ncbi:MAG: hypothetical protein KIT69_00410 [Propionibacteriaceae bacterium]|nr:hypothetical protein [Propionibacteriaceae bacterium]
MVHLGDPGAALKLIDGRTSPPAHVICFELLAHPPTGPAPQGTGGHRDLRADA